MPHTAATPTDAVQPTEPVAVRSFGLAIKQQRGQVTYDALVDAGFRLLAQRELQEISIADLASKAGYSVGAFYARFRSKDEFFDALISKHLETRTGMHIQLLASLPLANLAEEMMVNIVNYYWDNQNFWRAVLARGLRDPVFWQGILDHSAGLSRRFAERVAQEAKRSLNPQEICNISFGFQILFSTVNLAILARNSPACDDNLVFARQLARAFRLTCDFDRMVGIGKP